MWGFVLFGILIAMILNTILNWVFYDLLILIESQKFQMDWVKDGKPIGMFHVPPESGLFKGTLNRNQVLSKWVFNKPNWIKKDGKAVSFYRFFRITGIIQFSLFLLLVTSFIVIFFSQP
jgi:hypothetical protein